MFWVFLILGWIIVHGVTKGRYFIPNIRGAAPEVAAIIFAFGLVGGFVGMTTDMSAFGQIFLVSFLWFGILLLRSSRMEGNELEAEKIQKALSRMKQAKREEERRAASVVADAVARLPDPDRPEPAARIRESAAQQSRGPEVKTVDRSWDGSFRVAQNRQAELQQRFSNEEEDGQADNILRIRQEGEQGYTSDLDEVMKITREALGISRPAAEPLASAEQEPLQELPEDREQQAGAAQLSAADEADVADEPHGWTPPELETGSYEAPAALDRPGSIFSSGSGGASLFGNPGPGLGKHRPAEELDELMQANRLDSHSELTKPQGVLGGTDTPGAAETTPLARPAAEEVQRVLEQHRLGKLDDELVRPDAVLEQATEDDRKKDEGFHYKPSEGIKSRF